MKMITKINHKFCICPYCGKQLEVVTKAVNELYYIGLCRNCLVCSEVKIQILTDEEIRELASEG